LFASKPLISITAAVGRTIAIDKATQVKSRPSTARVKVILDLLDHHPDKVRLQYIDSKSGKIVEDFQTIVYDNLPAYCSHCKHQGHEDTQCRLLKGKKMQNAQVDDDRVVPTEVLALAEEMSKVEKLQGDARDYLNAKLQKITNASSRADIPVDRSLARISSAVNLVKAGNVDEGTVENRVRHGGQQNVVVTEKVNGDLIVVNAGQKRDGEGIVAGNRTGVQEFDLSRVMTGNKQQGIAVGDTSAPMKAKLPADIHAATIFARMNATGALKDDVDLVVTSSGQNSQGARQVEKVVKIPAIVGSNQEVVVALNATEDRHASTIVNIGAIAPCKPEHLQ